MNLGTIGRGIVIEKRRREIFDHIDRPADMKRIAVSECEALLAARPRESEDTDEATVRNPVHLRNPKASSHFRCEDGPRRRRRRPTQ